MRLVEENNMNDYFSFATFTLLGLFAYQSLAINDAFIAGYAAALLEHEFNIPSASLRVQQGVITLTINKMSKKRRDQISTSLKAIKGVVDVELSAEQPIETQSHSAVQVAISAPKQVLLPEDTLFSPLIADPRWPHFSMAYHYYQDDDQLKNVGATSFGESFSFYRGNAPISGQWEFGVQAGVFAIFDLDAESLDLINADYWVGFPLTYRNGRFSALGRIFHQSSHLGDEYLLRVDAPERINLSYESVDLKLSIDLGEQFRVYGGGGILFDQEPNIAAKTSQYGLEFQGQSYWQGSIRPVIALDINRWAENDWHADISLRAGIQLESIQFAGRKMQILLEYFDGFSPNGQFYQEKIKYFGLGTHLYF